MRPRDGSWPRGLPWNDPLGEFRAAASRSGDIDAPGLSGKPGVLNAPTAGGPTQTAAAVPPSPDATVSSPSPKGGPVGTPRATPDGKGIQRKIGVFLSVSTDFFAADGVDKCEVMVRPACPEAEALTDIRLEVNAEEAIVQLHEVLPILSSVPGKFRISLADRRCFATNEATRIVHALDAGEHADRMTAIEAHQKEVERAMRRGRDVE